MKVLISAIFDGHEVRVVAIGVPQFVGKDGNGEKLDRNHLAGGRAK